MDCLKWIKAMVDDLPYDRSYSKTEARVQIMYDIMQNNEYTLRGYSRQFGWSVHKVKDFLDYQIKGTPKANKTNGSKPATKQFKPPTEQEIITYIKTLEDKYPDYKRFDVEKFWHFYNKKGWIVGKTKMKDWKSAVHGAKKWCLKGQEQFI